jgi:hypothetical protein
MNGDSGLDFTFQISRIFLQMCQKSMQRPSFSQSPKRVGSGPLRPLISWQFKPVLADPGLACGSAAVARGDVWPSSPDVTAGRLISLVLLLGKQEGGMLASLLTRLLFIKRKARPICPSLLRLMCRLDGMQRFLRESGAMKPMA